MPNDIVVTDNEADEIAELLRKSVEFYEWENGEIIVPPEVAEEVRKILKNKDNRKKGNKEHLDYLKTGMRDIDHMVWDPGIYSIIIQRSLCDKLWIPYPPLSKEVRVQIIALKEMLEKLLKPGSEIHQAIADADEILKRKKKW